MDDGTRFDHDSLPENGSAEPAAERGARMPCIGLMGEFSAGKTTLINFLLGAILLPTRVTATQLPPVWMSYGKRAAHYVDLDGVEHDLDIEDLQTVPVDGVRYIKLFCEADILREFDLIDTPGISDPNIPDAHRAAVVDYVDAVIWCTHATQAWRESERRVWATIPEALQARSVLLATRADKLDARDRSRVQQRLQREIGDGFRKIIMFSATDAIRASEQEDEAGLLASSGAETLIETLHSIGSDIAAVSGVDRKARFAEGVTAEGATKPAASVRPTRVTPTRSRHVAPANDARADTAAGQAPVTTVDSTDEPGATAGQVSDTRSKRDPELDAALEAALDDAVDGQPDTAKTDRQGAPNVAGEAENPSPDDAGEATIGVLDLSKYEVKARQAIDEAAADVTEADEADDTSDVSDFVARAQTQTKAQAQAQAPESDAAEDIDENIECDAGEAEIEPAEAFSARAVWDRVLADNPVATVAELTAAFGQFIDALDQHGLVIAASAQAVDIEDEESDTSGWRKLG